jgi:hypothetical protein
MFAFLKKLYLKLRNFVAINITKAMRFAEKTIAAGRDEGRFLKRLGGYTMLVGAIVGAYLVAVFFGTLLLLGLISLMGSIGMIIGCAMLGFFSSDVTTAVLNFREGAELASEDNEEEAYFVTLDAVAAAI